MNMKQRQLSGIRFGSQRFSPTRFGEESVVSGVNIYDLFQRGGGSNPGQTINGTEPDQSNEGGGTYLVETGGFNTAKTSTGTRINGGGFLASAALFNSVRMQTEGQNLTIEGVILRGFSSGNPYITLNPMHQDQDNTWWCYFNRNGDQRIYKRVSGSLTLVASGVGHSYPSNVRRFVRVSFDGSVIRSSIFSDDAGTLDERTIQYTLLGGDPDFSSLKRFGISGFENNLANINNVGFEELKVFT